MLLNKLWLRVISGGLTCSEVMDFLMDQPTQPVGRNVESHAHMHTMEGFALARDRFRGDDFSFERKLLHWENPSHLYPEGDATYGMGRIVFGSDDSGNSYGYGGVMQARNRLAPDRTYVSRTGLGALPQVTRTTYTVYRCVGGGPPVAEVKQSMAEVLSLTVGRAAGQYMPKSAKEPATIRCIENTVVVTPAVRESPAHTMFPDAESLVMHLTAALLSDAGKRVVHYMMNNLAPGEQKTVGIFSKTAVLAVSNANTGVPNVMLERVLEVDQGQPRDPVTGFYPATGRVLTTSSAIDHIVTVLGYRATRDLNVITCFPSKVTTGASIHTATGPTEDIAEFVFGQHTKVTQISALPRVRW